MGSPFGNIEVRGARESNLNNISLDIPRRQITVFTGVAGRGKSPLIHGCFPKHYPDAAGGANTAFRCLRAEGATQIKNRRAKGFAPAP
jgi:excinuclease UvrABC ATPase subunit